MDDMKKQVKVNGTEIVLAGTVNLKKFLIGQGYNPDQVAVEHNGSVVSKSVYETCFLSDGDVMEVVRFVGGG